VIGRTWAMALGAVIVVACREPRPGEVVLRFAGGPPDASGDSVVVAKGGDTIVVRTAELVLREVLLQPQRSGECEEEEGERCAMLALGPVHVLLPLGPDAVALEPVAATPDTYGQVVFEVYRAVPGRDSAFLTAHPDLAGSSVRVTGGFSHGGARRDFVLGSDYNEVLELELGAPLVVAVGTASPLLLRVDVAGWFLSADHAALIDPATAGPDGPNAAQVRDNVRLSLSAAPADAGP